MKISRKTEYGLRAMVRLAKNKNNKAISIREISNIEGIPFEFLSKIFSDLERAKLVKAKHGANGGYFLAESPNKITAKDIVKTLEQTTPVQCFLCLKSRKCASKSVWKKIENNINKTLGSIRLSDLIKS